MANQVPLPVKLEFLIFDELRRNSKFGLSRSSIKMMLMAQRTRYGSRMSKR